MSWGDYPRLPIPWDVCSHRVLIRGSDDGQSQKGGDLSIEEKSERDLMMLFSELKIEEGTMSQGMQVASRRGKGKEIYSLESPQGTKPH